MKKTVIFLISILNIFAEPLFVVPKMDIDKNIDDIFDPFPQKIIEENSTDYSQDGTEIAPPIDIVQTLKFEAKIDNRVLLSGKWYKKDDNISTYKIVDINKTDVRLLNSETNETLYISVFAKQDNIKSRILDENKTLNLNVYHGK